MPNQPISDNFTRLSDWAASGSAAHSVAPGGCRDFCRSGTALPCPRSHCLRRGASKQLFAPGLLDAGAVGTAVRLSGLDMADFHLLGMGVAYPNAELVGGEYDSLDSLVPGKIPSLARSHR